MSRWCSPLALSRAVVLGAIVVAGCAGTQRPLGDARRQADDLAVFESQFFDRDHSYTPDARALATARLDQLRAQPGRLSDARFVLELAEIVALADNGHSAVVDRGSLPEMARVDLRLAPFGESFFVVRAASSHADLLGGRLVAIDDVPVERLRDAARLLRGGVTAWRDRFAPALLESPGQLHALGLIESSVQATYHFQMADGSARHATLAPASSVDRDSAPVTILDPAADGSEWRSLLSPDRAPWSLQDFSMPFRRRDAPELDAMVMQLHANIDVGGQSIAAFLEEADAERRRLRRANVVLDMRFNGGGNLQLTQPFMSSLPGRLPAQGRIVVLMSPWTFSAAISSVGYLKQAGGDRVVLVGETPGDRLQFWAEGQAVPLPNFGVWVLPATQRHDYLDGCRTFTDCHGYVKRIPIAVRSLSPDVTAPWTIERYASGADPAMDAAARLLKR